uniref:Pyruvate formate lyase family protein n=1 Tax=Desertifilum tharense IPPAS B-1220 TaxID=1781255 RepID=A0ACD5H1D9_9CYAN
MFEQWKTFVPGKWTNEVNVRDFIQKNYTPYEGDRDFLASATDCTQKLWHQVQELMKQEREKGILDADTKVPSTITSHAPGYINQDLEQIVGLQTDKPLKRAIMPNGGIRVVEKGLEAYGYKLDPQTKEIFTKYRKSHNDGVFDAYNRSMRLARHSGIITGLPDAYGRGRIIGDYRRVALYGIDFLIQDKKQQLAALECDVVDESVIRLSEELNEQIRALNELKQMYR